jgi:hypothetical protein
MTTKTAIPLELLDQLLSNYRKPEEHSDLEKAETLSITED